jgi:hypothetical protein
MKINIESNIKEFIQSLNDVQKKQLPYATMLATNNIAFDYLDKQKKEVQGGLNWKRKAPNTVRIKKATKSRPYAEIYVDESHWGYFALKQHFVGGDRHRKGMEKAMVALGYMYKHEILTPSPGVRIRPSTYVQMISQLKLTYKSGYDANETTRSRKRKSKTKTSLRFFIITGKSKSPLAPGIYARMSGTDKLVCMLRISEKPTYKKRFDMKKTLIKVYNRRGQEHFNKAWAHALSTAK